MEQDSTTATPDLSSNTLVVSPRLDDDDHLNQEEFDFWQRMMSDKRWTAHAFKVFVLMNEDVDLLYRELGSIFYVQLMDKWPVDAIELAEYAQKERKDDFVKKFIRSFCAARLYMKEELRAYFARTSGYRHYLATVR